MLYFFPADFVFLLVIAAAFRLSRNGIVTVYFEFLGELSIDAERARRMRKSNSLALLVLCLWQRARMSSLAAMAGNYVTRFLSESLSTTGRSSLRCSSPFHLRHFTHSFGRKCRSGTASPCIVSACVFLCGSRVVLIALALFLRFALRG